MPIILKHNKMADYIKFYCTNLKSKEVSFSETLIDDAYDYSVPLEKVYDRKYVMRLD